MEATAHICRAHGCGEVVAETVEFCATHELEITAAVVWLMGARPSVFGTPRPAVDA